MFLRLLGYLFGIAAVLFLALAGGIAWYVSNLNQDLPNLAELLPVVARALSGVPGIPSNLFVPTVKYTAGANAFDQVFKHKPVVARQLLEIISDVRIKATIAESFSETCT